MRIDVIEWLPWERESIRVAASRLEALPGLASEHLSASKAWMGAGRGPRLTQIGLLRHVCNEAPHSTSKEVFSWHR